MNNQEITYDTLQAFADHYHIISLERESRFGIDEMREIASIRILWKNLVQLVCDTITAPRKTDLYEELKATGCIDGYQIAQTALDPMGKAPKNYFDDRTLGTMSRAALVQLRDRVETILQWSPLDAFTKNREGGGGMSRYIDAEKAKEALLDFNPNWSETVFENIISSIPTADVAPVVHAHWIYRGNEHYSLCDWYERFECSRCRRKVKLSSKGEIEDLPYCNCGAKMDEEAKDDETGKAQN